VGLAGVRNSGKLSWANLILTLGTVSFLTRPEQASGSVVLDPEAFSQNGPRGAKAASTFGCYCSACTTSITLDDVLGNSRYILLAPTVVEGFHLDARTWTELPICGLVDYKRPRRELSDDACLGREVQKQLEEDFKNYFARRRLAVIRGKTRVTRLVRHFQGESQVTTTLPKPPWTMLNPTTGAPGTGKQSVAHSLAVNSGRLPLFLAPSDLGQAFGTLQTNLRVYAQLSFRWGVIVVL
jgi:hypothetical protein